MAPNLISLDDAAKLLNITAAELNDHRERQEIYGYRDGASWKFKQADIEKFKEKLAGGGSGSDDDMGLDDLDLDNSDDMLELATDDPASAADDSDSEDDDSIDVMLLSEAELGESAPGASSTIIGKPGEQSAAESDIKIVTDEDRAGLGTQTPGSDVNLGSGGDESSVLDDDSANLSLSSAAESDKPSPGSDISLGDDADVSAGEFSLEDGDSEGEGFDLADDSEAGADSSDEVNVVGDDDFVLGGSGVGSDITLGAADSGISLANPADSGLSLEEPFDLSETGSQQQDFDMDSDDMLSLSDDSESVSLLDDSSSELSEAIGDDDFLLEPSQDADSEESGSQVIALDEDSIGSDSFLEDSDASGESMLEDDSNESPLGGLDTGDHGMAAPAGAGVAVTREATFTTLNIVSLGTWTVFMLLCGMMMLDLTRNMWSWQGNFTVSSSIMDAILGMLP